MARGDGTGPMGMGPMTGRGAGYCAGYGVPGFMNAYGGRIGYGFGGGFGWGRGRRGGYRASVALRYGGYPAGSPYGYPETVPAYSADQEKEALQNQINYLEDQITNIRNRMEVLGNDDQSGNE